MSKKGKSLHFKKRSFAPPAPPDERQEGRLLPSAPHSGVPAILLHWVWKNVCGYSI